MSELKYSAETFGPSFSETVLAELDPRFSRENAEIAPQAQAMPFGLCLMKNSEGKYAPYAPGEEASPNEACAILLSPLPASETRQNGVVLRGFAIVNSARVVFDASVSDKKAAFAQLEKRNFIFETTGEDV